jgi:hypothetical protein
MKAELKILTAHALLPFDRPQLNPLTVVPDISTFTAYEPEGEIIPFGSPPKYNPIGEDGAGAGPIT